MHISLRPGRLGGHLLVGVLLLPFATAAAWAQTGQTIAATAHVESAGGVHATAPVTVVVDRLSTDAERDEVLAALRKGGTAATRALLAGRDAIGSVRVGERTTPVKFASIRTTTSGRLFTVLTGSPIAFIGLGAPDAKPTTGYDLGLVLLEVAASGPGRGELVPATKIRLTDQGAIATEDYSGLVVELSDVLAK